MESDQEQFHDSVSEAVSTAVHAKPNFSRIEFPKLSNTHSIEYWFIRLESWFRLQNIVDETVRFEVVVASLTPQLFDQVVDVIITPPAVEPYKCLKAAIIKKFADSEYTRVEKLMSTVPLGSQRPSHLLAEIRRAGATRDETILRVCWLRRLPATIRIVLSTSKAPLSELAEMADATFDTLQSENVSLSQVTQNSLSSNSTNSIVTPTIDAHGELIKCIQELILQINDLKNGNATRSRSRDRSNNQRDRSNQNNAQTSSAANRHPTCWFHRKFGTQARSCQSPCDFPSSPQSANRT